MGTEDEKSRRWQFSLARLSGLLALMAVLLGSIRVTVGAGPLFVWTAFLAATASGAIIGLIAGGRKGAILGAVCGLVGSLVAGAALWVGAVSNIH
jgi:hypothetical protein